MGFHTLKMQNSFDVYYCHLTDISKRNHKLEIWNDFTFIQIVFNPPLSVVVCIGQFISMLLLIPNTDCVNIDASRNQTTPVRQKLNTDTYNDKPDSHLKSQLLLTQLYHWSVFALVTCNTHYFMNSGDNVSVYSMLFSLVVRSVNVTIFYSCVMII